MNRIIFACCRQPLCQNFPSIPSNRPSVKYVEWTRSRIKNVCYTMNVHTCASDCYWLLARWLSHWLDGSGSYKWQIMNMIDGQLLFIQWMQSATRLRNKLSFKKKLSLNFCVHVNGRKFIKYLVECRF